MAGARFRAPRQYRRSEEFEDGPYAFPWGRGDIAQRFATALHPLLAPKFCRALDFCEGPNTIAGLSSGMAVNGRRIFS